MNAGRDVERLIAGWLAEEAAPGAPDRVLESTRQVVHRTNQRRFAAIWRETMFSPYRPLAMAAMLVVAVLGGALIGRLTAPSGPAAPATTPAPSATADVGVLLKDYRAARNSICQRYTPLADPLKATLDGDGRVYDPSLTEAARAPKLAALSQLLTMFRTMTDELRALSVPLDVSADHAGAVERSADINALIGEELLALGEGKWQGAETLDKATDPLARQIEAFESKYGLAACP